MAYLAFMCSLKQHFRPIIIIYLLFLTSTEKCLELFLHFNHCVQVLLFKWNNVCSSFLWLVSGVRQGTLTMENCVLQCETTGVIVRTSAHFTMNMCDLYGSKVSAAQCPDLKKKQQKNKNNTHIQTNRKVIKDQTTNRVRTFWSNPHNFIIKF